MPPLPPPQPPKTKRGLVIGLGLAIVVIVSLVIAFAFSKDDNDDSVTAGGSSGTESDTTVEGGAAPGETQPVTITGTPLPVLPDSGEDDAIGLKAPALSGYDFDGTPVSIEPGGTAKMLVFLAHWCPHCNREIPRLLDWKAQGLVPEGLDVVAVTTAVDANAPNYPPSKWIVDKQWTWPVFPDSSENDAAGAYGVNGFPYFVIVGTDGLVKLRVSGEIEIGQLNDLVRSALNS